MKTKVTLAIAALCSLGWLQAQGQSAADIAVLKGLAPVTVLLNTNEGKAALGANLRVTGGIQTGSIPQPTLLPFAEQQQQALRDAFITGSNLAELADGLGTSLGSAYLARFHYIDQKQTSRLQQSVADVIRRANAISSAHSNSGKYLFANQTTNGTTPVSPDAAAILKEIGGTQDVFGKAYGLAAGGTGAGPYGNSRPFQTEPSTTQFVGLDYFNILSGNYFYNHGPAMDLTKSPSYPSGHTTYGYTGAVLLAVLIPERYEQMIARGAEYGNDRILMGSHYAMDVMGGRTLALYDMAHLLATEDFQNAVKNARTELVSALEAGCGNTIEACAKEDTGRFSNRTADAAFYDATQTYNLPVVYPKAMGAPEDVAKLAPEAGYLLTVAFPSLTVEKADQMLTETEGPGGGFLDDGSPFGIYSRLNLIAAAHLASQIAAGK